MNNIQKQDTIEDMQYGLRKTAHFSIYMLLGILVFSCALTFKENKIIKFDISEIFILIYAIMDEFHQLFIPGRAGEYLDVCIDVCGGTCGVIFILMLTLLIEEIKKHKYKKIKLILEENNKLKIKKNVLFIASTGGHLNELLQIKPLFKKYNYQIVTEKTKVDDSYIEEYKNHINFLIYGTKKNLISYLFKFSVNSIISLYYFFKYQPEVVVSTGTHTAVPMCYIAKIFGSKVIYIETFANRTTKTVAGRLIYPIADTFVVQWEEMHKLYPKSVCWGWIY